METLDQLCDSRVRKTVVERARKFFPEGEVA
jgi:hypothetical protein